MLELLKRQYIKIEQNATFDDIDIFYNEESVESGDTLEEEITYD